MKKFEKYERRGLPGGPNEITSYMTGAVSIQGYKSDSPDKYNDFNLIPSGDITMNNVDFPVFGMDNLGNMATMMPGANYKFPGSMVFELPMAQRGDETSTDNPLLPFSAEKMRAYEAGEIDLSQLISDDRNIKDMPYYQDRYDFTDNTQTFYNQEPTIDPFKQTLKYTNLPEEYDVILQKRRELDPDDFMGGPPDQDDYPTYEDYSVAYDLYWDNYDEENKKLLSSVSNYNRLSFGDPVPFNPTIEYIDKASSTPSQLNEFYDQDLYDQYKYIRPIYSNIGDINDSTDIKGDGTILSDYLFGIPTTGITSKDDLKVKSYMITADKDISINDFLTVNPKAEEVKGEEKFFYPEYLNVPYSINDIISNPRYADEYNLQVEKTTKDGRPYYSIIGLPPSTIDSYEDGSNNVRTGILSPITVQIPAGGSRKLVASVPSFDEYASNFTLFNNKDLTTMDKDERKDLIRSRLEDYLDPHGHAYSPYSYGTYGGARQDRSDFTLSNFGVASNYGAVGQPTFGMRYLPEADQYDVTTTRATQKPEVEERLNKLEVEQQKEYERVQDLISDNFLLQYLSNDFNKSNAGKTLYYYEDDNGELLYAVPMSRWGTQSNQAGEEQTFLRNFEQFTTKDGKLTKPKMISEKDNPEKFKELSTKIFRWGIENADEGTIPTFQGQSNPGGGIMRSDLINPQDDDLVSKQKGGEEASQDFLRNWYQNRTVFSPNAELTPEVRQALIDRVNIGPQAQSFPLIFNDAASKNIFGQSDAFNDAIYIKPNAPSETYLHELTHFAEDNPYQFNIDAINAMASLRALTADMPETLDLLSDPRGTMMDERKEADYVTSPTETSARLMTIRERHSDILKPNKIVTKEDLNEIFKREEKLLQEGKPNLDLQQLYRMYGPAGILSILNEYVSAEPQENIYDLPMAQRGIPMLDPNRPISSQTDAYTPPNERDNIAVQDAMNQANVERADIRGRMQAFDQLNEEAQRLGFNDYEEYSIAKDRENTMGVDNTFTTQASDLGMYNTYLPEITIQSKPEEPGFLGNLFPYGGAEALPFVGEGIDAIGFADAAKKGNYGDAALYALGFALPFVGGAALKRFFRGSKQTGKATNNAIESEVRSLELSNNPSIAKELAEPKPVKNDWTIEEILELPDDELEKVTGRPRWAVEAYVEKGINDRLLHIPNNAWTPTNAFVGKVDAARKRLTSYYRSSAYKQRLRNGLGISSSEADDIIERMVKQVEDTDVKYNNYGTKSDRFTKRDTDAHAGRAMVDGNQVDHIYLGEHILEYDDATIDDILQHEFGHTSTREVADFGGMPIEEQFPDLNLSEGMTYKPDYFSMPVEARERGMSVLRYLDDNNLSIDDFAKMDIGDLMDAPYGVRQFKDVYEPTQQADYLKNIFSVAPIIGIGTVGAATLPDEMDTRQTGGEKDPNRKGGMKQRDPNMKYNNTVSPLGKTGYAVIREENLTIPNPNEGKFIYQYQEGGELEQRAIAMGESPEYARAVQTMINEGATIQDLASRRIGTVSGLSTLFPDAEMGSVPQRSSSSSSSSSGSGANSEDNSRYYNRALKFFSEGKTIDDLVNMRYGTRDGLIRMFPNAPISSSATYSPSPENKPSPMPQQTPAQVSSGPTEIPAQPAMITPEPIIQRKDVDAGLAADAQMAREQMRSGSLSTQPNITYESYLPETIIYGEKEEPLGYNSISSPSFSGQFDFSSDLNKFLPIPAASTEPFFTVPEGTFRGPSSIEEIRQRSEEQQEVGKGILQNEYTSSGVDKYTNISFDEYPSYLTEDMEGYDQVINEAEQDVSQSTNTNSPYADDVTKTEINRRLAYDIPRYGEFMSNPNAANRTGNLRQNDANIFFADVAKPNSVIIDIGAGLGNSDPREAGISTYELFKNPKIQQNNVTVIASDIAPEAKKFIGRENNPHGDMEAYSIPINEEDYGDINNFLTPITDILKDKGVSDVEDIYLRATNGIDIIADEDITEKHFEHIGNTLKDKNITYVYNNMILYKPKGANQFTKIGNISNTGMDHKNPSWIGKDFDPTRRSHYLLNDDLFGDGYVPARRFGGSMPSYQKGGSFIDLIRRKAAEARAAAENVDKDAGFFTRAIQAVTANATDNAVTPDAVTPDMQQVVDVVDKPKVTINPTDVFDADQLRKGVKYVESKDGVLMMNPESTATGLYGQLFSEFKKIPGLYSGTREEFAKDLDAQERIFSMRINDEIEEIPGLERNAYQLTKEYLPQLGDKFNFTLNEVAALSNFLGRDGARQYFGNVLRDGRSLADVFPDKYGPDPEQANKTPEEYLEEFRKVVKEHGGETNGISLDSMGIDALSALMLPKYVDYINGVDESEEARRVYDKLNRKVYAYAKKGGMTAPNYIASNILKLGGSV